VSELSDLTDLIEICIEDLIDVGLSNPFTKKPYIAWRETKGKNRSPEIDAMILRNGGKPGDPYCMYGVQDMLRILEKRYRFKFDLPKTGSTQKFFNETNPAYISKTPIPYSIAIYKKGNTGLGHAAWCLWRVRDSEKIRTFEFNTSDNDQGDARDGEGCYTKIRNIGGFGSMELRGFVNIFKAICV
jgi:hypothetical protein